jgi:putative tricarboxylic transport membrane protein
MELKRYLVVLATIVFGWGFSAPSTALAWEPKKPVEVVVHTDPGGGSDVFARHLAELIEREKLLPQRMVISNRAGGSGAVAMAYMAGKKGDDHTIGYYTPTWWVTPLIRKEAKYTIQDLTPIAGMIDDPLVAVVRADSPYKTMKEFVEAARKSPGQLKQSGGSVTAITALYRVLIQKATGAKWDHISFPGGGERLANLLGGHTHIQLNPPQVFAEHVRAGTLRIIATFTQKRLPDFPDVPTIREQGIEIPLLIQSRGVLGVPGMTPEAVKYWEDLYGRLVKTPSWQKYLKENQIVDDFIPSGELGKFWNEQTDLMRSVLPEAGVKVVR